MTKLTWVANANDTLYDWRSDDDTLDVTVFRCMSDGSWWWEGTRYADTSRAVRLSHMLSGGPTMSAAEALAAAERWIAAQPGG